MYIQYILVYLPVVQSYPVYSGVHIHPVEALQVPPLWHSHDLLHSIPNVFVAQSIDIYITDKKIYYPHTHVYRHTDTQTQTHTHTHRHTDTHRHTHTVTNLNTRNYQNTCRQDRHI